MGGDWIDLGQDRDRDRWWELVTTVMKLGFHKTQGISWLPEELLASPEGLYSMKLVLVRPINLQQNSYILKLFQNIPWKSMYKYDTVILSVVEA